MICETCENAEFEQYGDGCICTECSTSIICEDSNHFKDDINTKEKVMARDFGDVFMNSNGNHRQSAASKQAERAASRAANFSGF